MSEYETQATTIRPCVGNLAICMESRLKEKDWKGGWQAMTLAEILQRIREETDELEEAIKVGDVDLIMNDCVDVANFCAFMFDVVGIALADGGVMHA